MSFMNGRDKPSTAEDLFAHFLALLMSPLAKHEWEGEGGARLRSKSRDKDKSLSKTSTMNPFRLKQPFRATNIMVCGAQCVHGGRSLSDRAWPNHAQPWANSRTMTKREGEEADVRGSAMM